MTTFELTRFGRKFVGDAGILQLMDDLGAMAGKPGVIMMGGGNPSHIPSVQALLRERMAHLLEDEAGFAQILGAYDGPGGHTAFVSALADFFRSEYGWPITEKNIALTNGSQMAFFMLFNLFAGKTVEGKHKRILLPLAPEYIGYEDAGIEEDIFVAFRPKIDLLENRFYKYRVDFDALQIDDTIGAMCVSRPTNPTGNVLTQDEITQLSDLAKQHNIPLIIDNAYGLPFPSIIYTDVKPHWEPHVVLSMSLSKLGLPGARTGIVIAHEEIISCLTGMNAVLSLAPNSMGAALALDMVQSRDILRISNEQIKPHYQQRAEAAVAHLQTALDGTDYYIHKPEGAFFLWLWFRNLPISSQELYERLKARGVVIVPGHYFFPGLAEDWQHKYECIRLSYAGELDQLEQGIAIIGEEIHRAYSLPQ
ncbi:MAG: valine--pyruvate transaminase [Candidatus Promineifilaceae bacterium]